MLDKLRKQPDMTAKVLDTNIRKIQDDLIATCSERGHSIIGDFACEIDRVLSDFCRDVVAHIAEDQVAARSGPFELRNWTEGVPVQRSLHLNQSGYEKTRNVIGGGMMGFGITATVINLLTGGFFLLPTLIVGGAFAGAAAGAAGKRQLEEALAKTERVLRETVTAVRTKALQDFNRIATERERSIRDLFQSAIRGTREQYEREIKQIRERGSHTQEALRKATAERSAHIATINLLTSRLQSIGKESDCL